MAKKVVKKTAAAAVKSSGVKAAAAKAVAGAKVKGDLSRHRIQLSYTLLKPNDVFKAARHLGLGSLPGNGTLGGPIPPAPHREALMARVRTSPPWTKTFSVDWPEGEYTLEVATRFVAKSTTRR